MTALALVTATPHTPWCTNHDHEIGTCRADDINTMLPDGQIATINILGDHDSTPVIMLSIDYGTPIEISPEGAHRLAHALQTATATTRGITVGARVTWTSQWNGITYTGTVTDVRNWNGRDEASVDTDTDGEHKVTTHIDAHKLTLVPAVNIPGQRATGPDGGPR